LNNLVQIHWSFCFSLYICNIIVIPKFLNMSSTTKWYFWSIYRMIAIIYISFIVLYHLIFCLLIKTYLKFSGFHFSSRLSSLFPESRLE
jgi:hypothetical protein